MDNYIEKSPGERQQAVQDIFVGHERHNETEAALKRFHMPVEGGLPSTGTISAIIGDSRVGKSFAVQKYISKFKNKISDGCVEKPVLLVDTPVSCNSAGLAFAFMDALGLPASKRMTLATLQTRVPQLLVQHKVKLVVVDEAQEVFRENNRHAIQFARGFFRKVLDTGSVGIVCVGLPETYNLIADDPQLKGRGGLPHKFVQPYDWNAKEDRGCFRLLCKKFGDLLPFAENPALGAPEIAYSLFLSSDGNIGRLKDLIAAASFEAINDNALTVSRKHFAFAFDERKRPGETFNPFRHDPQTVPNRPRKATNTTRPVDPFSKVVKRGRATA